METAIAIPACEPTSLPGTKRQFRAQRDIVCNSMRFISFESNSINILMALIGESLSDMAKVAQECDKCLQYGSATTAQWHSNGSRSHTNGTQMEQGHQQRAPFRLMSAQNSLKWFIDHISGQFPN